MMEGMKSSRLGNHSVIPKRETGQTGGVMGNVVHFDHNNVSAELSHPLIVTAVASAAGGFQD